jgi:type IV pilus assembly protein PilM
MVIDLGAATSKAYIVQNGIIRLSHIINRGSQDITLALSRSHGMSVEQAERLKREEGLSAANKNVKESIVLTLDYIFSEANRVLLNYEQQHHKSAQRIVLTGGGALLSGITENAKKHLERDVEIARPFASIETPAYLDDVVETAGPSFSVAAGLALRRLSELE